MIAAMFASLIAVVIDALIVEWRVDADSNPDGLLPLSIDWRK